MFDDPNVINFNSRHNFAITLKALSYSEILEPAVVFNMQTVHKAN